MLVESEDDELRIGRANCEAYVIYNTYLLHILTFLYSDKLSLTLLLGKDWNCNGNYQFIPILPTTQNYIYMECGMEIINAR